MTKFLTLRKLHPCKRRMETKRGIHHPRLDTKQPLIHHMEVVSGQCPPHTHPSTNSIPARTIVLFGLFSSSETSRKGEGGCLKTNGNYASSVISNKHTESVRYTSRKTRTITATLNSQSWLLPQEGVNFDISPALKVVKGTTRTKPLRSKSALKQTAHRHDT